MSGKKAVRPGCKRPEAIESRNACNRSASVGLVTDGRAWVWGSVPTSTVVVVVGGATVVGGCEVVVVVAGACRDPRPRANHPVATSTTMVKATKATVERLPPRWGCCGEAGMAGRLLRLAPKGW